jgi:hypothetical protein
MRYFFFFIFFILVISFSSIVAVNTITGKITNTPNCPGAHTYAFYRTLEEREQVERMWLKSGFIVVANEYVPESFESSGQPRFLCLRRMTRQEMKSLTMLERDSAVTIGSSV